MINNNSKLNIFIEDLVFNYYKRDIDGSYSIDVSSLSDHDKNKFCAFIIENDSNYASEATGPDNDNFLNSILPSLITYLKDTFNKENKENYLNCLSYGIQSYLHHNMQFLLENKLSEIQYSLENEAA